MESREDLLHKIESLITQNHELRARLDETEETLRGISTGEVDALVIYSENHERIYTLQGADYAYRVMVESIHEGAANLAEDGTILYANKRLSEMLSTPLEKVLGSSIYHYLSPEQRNHCTNLLRKGVESYGRAEFTLTGSTGSTIPVLVSASAAEVDGRQGICLIVTDLSEQKQAMAREKELQIRLTEQREEERLRIARNLHDGPLQDLIGMSFTLQEMISAPSGQSTSSDLATIRENVLSLARELRNVCNELRPLSSIRFGLSKAIQYQSEELQDKYPHLTIHLYLTADGQSIPAEISTALLRIYQECMNNVIRHSEANEVNVKLVRDQKSLLMEISDNGKGFEPPQDWITLARQGHLGLVGMRERAESMGGVLRIQSAAEKGTTIQVEVPCENNTQDSAEPDKTNAA